MNTQQFLQASLNGGRAIPRRGWLLTLGTVLVLALAIYAVSLGAPALTNASTSVAQQIDPGTQSVMDYLRAHRSIPDHALPLDPAQQSVVDYLRAHGTDITVRAQNVPDAATQGVIDYLRAHSSIPNHVLPLDPATQSVWDYIHAHQQ